MKGRGELVLYLDFDGVLHHENVLWHKNFGTYLSAPDGHVLFQHAELLEQLLAPHPEVQIVLSTTWVRRYGLTKAAKNLRPALRSRVVGATFRRGMDVTEFDRLSRGQQVWADVARRRPRDWLALDDAHEDWPVECLDKFVRTHKYEGLCGPGVLADVREKLRLVTQGFPDRHHRSG